MSANHALTNLERAEAAWGSEMPRWVRLLATACDATSQRVVADAIKRSSGTVSRLLSKSYAGDYGEAETLVRARYGAEDVVCPLWGSIPLPACIRARRRSAPPRHAAHHRHAQACGNCPNNSDRTSEEE